MTPGQFFSLTDGKKSFCHFSISLLFPTELQERDLQFLSRIANQSLNEKLGLFLESRRGKIPKAIV